MTNEEIIDFFEKISAHCENTYCGKCPLFIGKEAKCEYDLSSSCVWLALTDYLHSAPCYFDLERIEEIISL